MTYATVMVYLQSGASNTSALRIAGDLAERFGCRIIGITAAQPLQFNIGEGYVSGDLIQQGVDEISTECKNAESEFYAMTKMKEVSSEWRSDAMCVNIAAYVAHEARCADIIVTSGPSAHAGFDIQRQVKVEDLLMQAGRPVLIVPNDVQSHCFNSVIVGWKDTQETRRAISDALPLMRRASHVTVVQIANENDITRAHYTIKDVCAWLKQHGIDAIALVVERRTDEIKQLQDIALEQSADVVIAGAYGHSRLYEWALGGMTRELLAQEKFLTFLSH